MFGLAEMFRGMAIFRGVAAAYVATRLAQAQVDPSIAHLQAFFAALRIGGRVLYLTKV
jgi:hypothetical protein